MLLFVRYCGLYHGFRVLKNDYFFICSERHAKLYGAGRLPSCTEGCGFQQSQPVSQGLSTYHWVIRESQVYRINKQTTSSNPRLFHRAHLHRLCRIRSRMPLAAFSLRQTALRFFLKGGRSLSYLRNASRQGRPTYR